MNLKYIKKLDERKIWEEEHSSGNIELFDFSRSYRNKESVMEAVIFVASECYGVEPKDKEKLYERLLNESAGKPSSTFEFIRDHNDTSLYSCLRNTMPMFTNEQMLDQKLAITLEGMESMVFNAVATFRIKVPVFLAQQITRHRQFAFQGLSRRYQDDKKRPFEFWISNDDRFSCHMASISETAEFIYKRAIKDGVNPEVARAVIPQGAYTEYWMQGDVEAWANYFNVRLDKKAQSTHRELAKEMLDMIKDNQPRLFEHISEGLVDNE